MTDYLLELSRNAYAKSLVKRLKLPVPLPEPLHRGVGPWEEALLKGATIALGGKTGTLSKVLSTIVKAAGGVTQTTYEPETRLDGLLFDATGLTSPAELGQLYDFIKPRLPSLRASGRVVIIGVTQESAKSPTECAAFAALVGFTKSLAKELGRRGSTAQLINVAPKARDADRLTLPLTFLLSMRSAFISGQVLTLSDAVDPTDAVGGTPWIQSLKGKTALVTGAAQGIGATIAAQLAAAGAKVVGLDRPPLKDALDGVMRAIGGIAWAHDLLDPRAVKWIVDKVQNELSDLDILVNNAGITRDKTLARMPRDWWDDTLNINLQIPIALTEALALSQKGAAPILRRGGRIVFLSSISGIGGNGGQSNYAASKSGLIGYTRALAPVVAPRGITVNAVAPGFIETAMTKKIPLATREVARRMNALSQAGTPNDIAEAVTMLTSPGAFAITGSTLRVCGLNLLGA